MSYLFKSIIITTLLFSLVSCGGFKKVDMRKQPVNMQRELKKMSEKVEELLFKI